MSASGVLSSTLAAAIPAAGARLIGEDRIVGDLFHDSRDVVAGAGFIAIRGAVTDGHDHVAAACTAAVNLLVVDHEVEADCPQLVVDDTRARMAALAATVHGYPATELRVVGVTGTNGKTTVTHMVEAITAAAGATPGIVGTVGAHIGGEALPLARTTPEATDLHRLLRRMVDGGVTVAALEVSSHALVYGRADAIVFDAVGFTNLSQDHLDFHGTMEDYFLAKAELFTAARARRAVIWTADPAGARLAEMTELPVTTAGFGPAGSYEISGEIVATTPQRTELLIRLGAESTRILLPVVGSFNAANALVAAGLASHVGFGIDAIAAGLENLSPVPGRFEQVPNAPGFAVIVDYAHTPAAVANAIAVAGDITSGRVIAVVGAAGDRDPEKRAPMGAAAASADVAIITSDNPRTEDPGRIVAAVLAGAGGASSEMVAEVDRRTAIRRAIAAARPGDTVLILGKGHEGYQEFADRTIDFDDRAVAAAELQARGREVS